LSNYCCLTIVNLLTLVVVTCHWTLLPKLDQVGGYSTSYLCFDAGAGFIGTILLIFCFAI